MSLPCTYRMIGYNVIEKIECGLSGVPWYHSLVWWFRDFYPYSVDVVDDNGSRVIRYSKYFKCRWLARRFIDKNPGVIV